MYGVLYALSPDVLPTKDHKTGKALIGGANRVFGVTVHLCPVGRRGTAVRL